MRQLLENYLRDAYPLTFSGLGGKNPETDERAHLFERMTASLLDQMTGLLRKEALIELYLKKYAPLEIRLLTAQSTQEEVVTALHSVANSSDGGAIIYGDAAYLKIANNVSTTLGDWMLTQIAACISGKFTLEGRFRSGDEFILYHAGLEAAIHEACSLAVDEMSQRQVAGLPIRVDFGVAQHATVAAAYIKLIEAGWQSETGRLPVKVFFDIAVKIAEVRSNIVKVHQRAKLSFGLYKYMQSGQNPEFGMLQYLKLLADLTRGKHLTPEDSWYSVADIDQFLINEALALLSPAEGSDLFDQVTSRIAESIFVHLA
jgi:hypothetical protein